MFALLNHQATVTRHSHLLHGIRVVLRNRNPRSQVTGTRTGLAANSESRSSKSCVCDSSLATTRQAGAAEQRRTHGRARQDTLPLRNIAALARRLRPAFSQPTRPSLREPGERPGRLPPVASQLSRFPWPPTRLIASMRLPVRAPNSHGAGIRDQGTRMCEPRIAKRDGARLGDGTSPSGPPPPPCPPSTPAGPPRLGQDRGGRPAQGPAGLGPSAAPAAEALGGARGQRQQPKAPPGPRRGGGGGCLAGDLPGAGSGDVGRALAEASQRSRGGDAGTASCRQRLGFLAGAVARCLAMQGPLT